MCVADDPGETWTGTRCDTDCKVEHRETLNATLDATCEFSSGRSRGREIEGTEGGPWGGRTGRPSRVSERRRVWQPPCVFDREQLERAVALSNLGHAFMKWLGERDRDAALEFDRTHERLSVPEATRDWVERNYLAIPVHCRPGREDLASFSNLIGTYLETSFDLVPGRSKFETSNGCFCSVCTSFIDMSSLKTKRLGRHDKEDARQLVRRYVRDRAVELGRPLDDARIEALVNDASRREALAMATWGRELLRRLDGDAAGPAVLALWRMFAWLPAGSPRPGFRISAEAILQSDQANAAAIAAAAA